MTEQRVPRIEASYDSRREWHKDPKGYFLVKVFYAKGLVGIRHMNYRHEPLVDIYGTGAEAIVQTAVRKGLVSTLQHAAYLGHELQKAETALRLKLEYVQDKELDYAKKARKKESGNRP
jgi:tetrahydromethanopterin S-methyltransferase subunit A